MPADPVLRLRGVRKDYRGLRPLRVDGFELHEGETVGVSGFDRAAAEVLVNLITAATLPDEGDVEVFGVPTSVITDADAWLQWLDRFGLVSDRVALVDELSVEQNLALSTSLDVIDMSPALRDQVGRLAAEVGLTTGDVQQPMAAAGPVTRLRVRLARALAPEPRLLLVEHPNAAVPPEEAARLAADLAGIAARRRLAMLLLTADAAFARSACRTVLVWQPASGLLSPLSRWQAWAGRLRRGSVT